jgi:hypothetical protein
MALAALILAMGCGRADEPAPDTRRVADAPELILTDAGLGPARFCMPLSSAAATLGQSRDTIFESEEVRWPAKIVSLSDGGRVFLESSWIDSTRLWTLSTNSASVRTRAGTRVGMTLNELPPATGPLSLRFPEGRLILVLEGDNAIALLDTATERGVYADTALIYPLERIPRTARIRELAVSRSCTDREAAA